MKKIVTLAFCLGLLSIRLLSGPLHAQVIPFPGSDPSGTGQGSGIPADLVPEAAPPGK